MTHSRSKALHFSPCTADQFLQVLDFLDLCFKKEDKHWFAKNLAPIFDGVPEKIERHICVRINKDLVGIFGIYPFTLRIGNACLPVGGIGSVCVHPAFRNRAIMSEMLRHADHILKTEGYALSWLRGDRFRYGNYCWEVGCGQREYTITRRDLDRYFPRPNPVELKKVSSGSIEKLSELYRNFHSAVVRSAEQWQYHIQRPWARWLLSDGPTGTAYVVYHKNNPRKIIEIQGNPQTSVSLLSAHLKNNGIDAITIPYPDMDDSLSCLFNGCYNHIRIEPAGMIRVIDATQAWALLVPEIEKFPPDSQFLSKRIQSTQKPSEKQHLLTDFLTFASSKPSLSRTGSHGLIWWISELDYI